MASRQGQLGLLAALVYLSASPAIAGNTRHPRTPVLWPEDPCIRSVEAGLDASFVFTYEIPFEDTQLSIDELPDSRTHQFIAFCRQWPAGEPPPPYVSVADLQRAIDEQVETEPELLDDPEATLETSIEWAGCWTRVTPDDARRPITDAAASEPVEWLLDAVPAGTWMLAGYTWEPPLNLWSRAPGIVRVLDPDAATPPAAAAAMALIPEGLELDASVDIPVCVAAEPDAQLHLEWAVAKDDPRVWTSVQSQAVEGADNLSFEFPSSEDYQGDTLLLRARVEQDASAGYVSHGLVRLNVYAPPLGGDDEGEDEESSDTSGSDGETEDGSDDASETAAESDAGAAEDAARGCRVAPVEPPPPGACLVLFALLLRTRARPWSVRVDPTRC